ncbi:MAG: TPM domain-containing protein [Oscillospiraceae bacterium]|nr:TPM domain-containing protein [Oscillospiraceae bacterium]MBQ6850618.1 TPM domain-containing protein [Oscillospiraceae bacterium]
MKKNFLSKLFALTIAVLLAANFAGLKAFAVNDYGQYIFDDAGMLTAAEFESLNSYAKQISEYYECGVHILTTDSEEANEYNIQMFSEDEYLRYIDYGWGEDKDGFLLVLGTYDRSYWLLAYGPKGNYALTDYAKDEMANQFLDNFRNDDWAGGFNDYLSYANYVLDCASKGQPVDVYYDTVETDIGPEAYGVAAIIGMIIAAITCSSYKKQMRTAVTATKADAYVVPGDIDMRVNKDIFRYETVDRTLINDSDDNNRSRGGTTVNSRGFSGKGGKY